MTPSSVALVVLAATGWGVAFAQAVTGWAHRRALRRQWQRQTPMRLLSAEERRQARDLALRAIARGHTTNPLTRD